VLSGGWILGEPLGAIQYAALAFTVVALGLVLLVPEKASADKAPVVPE
jgi:hypothetical protein